MDFDPGEYPQGAYHQGSECNKDDSSHQRFEEGPVSFSSKWKPRSIECLRGYTLPRFSQDLIAGLTVGPGSAPAGHGPFTTYYVNGETVAESPTETNRYYGTEYVTNDIE